MRNIAVKLLLLLFCIAGYAVEEKPFVVLITSYNNKRWVRTNLDSVFCQNYSNYRVLYIDDCSTDGTADEVERLVKKSGQEGHFQLIRNKERLGGMHNLYLGVHLCEDEEIIANLDGDDWLAHPHVLEQLNHVYTTQNVYLTHGTFVRYPSGISEWCLPIPEEIVQANAFRTFRCPSHLKTFYAWLFKKIDVEDLKYLGAFAQMGWDAAMMYPMLEMAGERHAFIPDIIYVYNQANPINDNRIDAKKQCEIADFMRAKRPYSRLP
jgi:glycosyltransferase involved in cell wall biosynthesis